jgi:hypothetical protein
MHTVNRCSHKFARWSCEVRFFYVGERRPIDSVKMKISCLACLFALGVCINSVTSFSINIHLHRAGLNEGSHSIRKLQLRTMNVLAKANDLPDFQPPLTNGQSSRRDALFQMMSAAVVFALPPTSAQAQIATAGPPQQEKMVGPGKDRNKIKVKQFAALMHVDVHISDGSPTQLAAHCD